MKYRSLFRYNRFADLLVKQSDTESSLIKRNPHIYSRDSHVCTTTTKSTAKTHRRLQDPLALTRLSAHPREVFLCNRWLFHLQSAPSHHLQTRNNNVMLSSCFSSPCTSQIKSASERVLLHVFHAPINPKINKMKHITIICLLQLPPSQYIA